LLSHGKLGSDVHSLASLLERALPIGILGLAMISVPVLLAQPEGIARLTELRKELDRVHRDAAALRREIETLRGEVSELRDNPAAVERIARDQLGLVRRNEVVFQFSRSKP
jgi:cell division protein FtsB